MTWLLKKPKERLTIFTICAPEDIKYDIRLKKHFSALEKQGVFDVITQIGGSQIETYVSAADFILLLISSDFNANQDCEKATKLAMQRRDAENAWVIPILIRAVSMPSADLQMLPRDGRSVAAWEDEDAAFAHIVDEVVTLSQKILHIQKVMPDSNGTPSIHELEAAKSYPELHRANMHLKQEQYDLAIQWYDQASQFSMSDADRSQAYIQTGVAYYQLEDYTQAVSYYNRAIALLPSKFENADLCIKKGWALYRIEEYEEARNSCEEALDAVVSVEAYELKSYILCRLKQYDEALMTCEKAIQLNSRSANIYDTKSWALYGQEKYQASLEASKQAIYLDPNLASAYNNKGRALNQLRDYRPALKAYKKAIDIYQQLIRFRELPIGYHRQKLANVYVNCGAAYYGLRESQKAISSYTKAIDWYQQVNIPNDGMLAEAYRYRGEVFLAIGKLNSALENFEAATTHYERELLKLRDKDNKSLIEYKQTIKEMCSNYIDICKIYNDLKEYSFYKRTIEISEKVHHLKFESSLLYEIEEEAYLGIGDRKNANRAHRRMEELRQRGK